MPISPAAKDSIKATLDGVSSQGTTGINGLVFLAVDKTGDHLVSHASGTRSIDSKDPMDLDTAFWMASCTKLFTCIAVLQQVEAGKIPLDDADFVGSVAPEIKAKKVFADGVTPKDQEKQVTMRMLLSHTAGFAYSFMDPRVYVYPRFSVSFCGDNLSCMRLRKAEFRKTRPDVNAWTSLTFYLCELRQGIDEFVGDEEQILKSPMVNQPGSMWEYGVSMDWAGIILERTLNTKLGDYFQQHIFTPLQISTMTMFPSASTLSNLAQFHQRDPTTQTLAPRPHFYESALTSNTSPEEKRKNVFQSGGAGLFGAPKDFAKVLATLLNDGTSPETGKQILNKETVELMFENQIKEFPDFARSGAPPANPLLCNPLPEIYPQPSNPPQGWSFAGFVTIAPGLTGRGTNTVWWSGLANLFWWVDREKGVGGVIASQVFPFGDPVVMGAWGAAEAGVYQGLS
ncbi:unnamed protein product [Periconia digitata]|uniref:Beta-lactamase-related domain-containing protein n=1 Tax=Periconia digitata TaxID=1303443 RepID=A0A9W4UHX5_9PLEO|nr:unnamed protein product [Periconia digitata]